MISLKTNNWIINNIETILFDKDGTFIDLHYFWGKMTELRAENIINHFDMNKDMFSKLCLFLGYDVATGKMLSDGITALYSRPKIIDIFLSEKLSISISNSIAIQDFLPIPLSLSSLILFIPNVFLFPVNDLIFSLLETYIVSLNSSTL